MLWTKPYMMRGFIGSEAVLNACILACQVTSGLNVFKTGCIFVCDLRFPSNVT